MGRGRKAETPAGGGLAGDEVGLPRRQRTFAARFRNDYPLLLMVAPTILLLLVFNYIPMIGNLVAFMDYVPYLPIQDSPWVGLDKFRDLFGDSAFWASVVNTLQFTLLIMITSMPVQIALALLINSLLRPWLKATIQSIIYLPHFLSWVIVVGFFQKVVGEAGVLNQYLAHHDMTQLHLMTNPATFKYMVATQVVWKEAGWGTIIFLAALAGIDDALYESAAIDSAGAWRRFWHVTLPGIRPIIVLLLIMTLGNALSVGFEQMLLQRDMVGPDAAEVLDTYVYYKGVVGNDWSIGVAAGLFKGVVGLVLILLANKVAHLLGEDGVYASNPK